MTSKRAATDEDDVFHYVSYIHFKNNIYELDGLREGPILIAENIPNENWIETIKPSILNRISLYTSNEIKFNLLALVPNRILKATEEENMLQIRLDSITKHINNLKGINESENQDIHVIIIFIIK
jgi:ubiquitin carboxyl-terminal hydrolase L5